MDEIVRRTTAHHLRVDIFDNHFQHGAAIFLTTWHYSSPWANSRNRLLHVSYFLCFSRIFRREASQLICLSISHSQTHSIKIRLFNCINMYFTYAHMNIYVNRICSHLMHVSLSLTR